MKRYQDTHRGSFRLYSRQYKVASGSTSQELHFVNKMESQKKSKRRWFVLLGAHVSMIVFGGTYRSFGVVLVEWQRYFDTSLAEVSAIMSVLAGSVLLSGFLSGPVITRLGCHHTLLVGGIFIVSGTILSAFAPNPIYLCFTTGLLSGLGVGFIKTSSNMIVALYFKKGYSRANGVMSAGVAVGIMAVPPLLQLCIDHFGWRGTLLIFSGIQAQVIPAALISRPPKNRKSPSSSVRLRSEKPLLDEANSQNPAVKIDSKTCDGDKHNGLSKQDFETRTVPGTDCGVDISASLKEETENHRTETDFSASNGDSASPAIGDRAIDDDDEKSSKKDVNVEQSAKNAIEPSPDSQPSWFQRLLKSSGWTLFGESVGFTLFQICQIAIGICYSGIMTHFVASAVYSGIDEQSASFLVSILGIASLLSRLGNGWLIDLKFISAEHLYVVAMFVFGAAMVVSRATTGYGWYIFIAILCGASSGVFKCLVPVVLRKYVGLANLAPALGVWTVFAGIGDLVGPVFAGALYDAQETYDVPFYVAGSMLIVSSFLLLLEPPLRRCKEKYKPIPAIEEEGDALA